MPPSSQLHALLVRQGFSVPSQPADNRAKLKKLHAPNESSQTTTELSLPRRVEQRRTRLRPFESTPLEIVERILSFLPLEDLIRLRRLDRSVRFIVLATRDPADPIDSYSSLLCYPTRTSTLRSTC